VDVPPEILAVLKKEEQARYVRQLWTEASEGVRDIVNQIGLGQIDPSIVMATVSTLIVLYYQVRYYDKDFRERWKEYTDNPTKFQENPAKIQEFYADIGDILYSTGLLDIRSPLSEVNKR